MRPALPSLSAIIVLGAISVQALQAQPPRGDRGGGGPDFGRGGGGELIDSTKLRPVQRVASIPDRETFDRLSYQGPMRMDSNMSDLQFAKFAMEIELKITKDNNHVIKQARPWVFSSEQAQNR